MPRAAGQFVVSLTTSPHRITRFRPVFESFLAQTRQPVNYLLHLPERFRDRERYVVPEWLRELSAVRINRLPRDPGSIAKLLPALDLVNDSEMPILTVDDDVVLPPRHFEELTLAAAEHPDTAFCTMGFRFVGQTIVPVRERAACDCLQGFSACCYRRRHFDANRLRREFDALPTPLRINDDVILSNHVAGRGIARAVVPPPGKLRFQPWSDEDPAALKSVGEGTHRRYLKLREHLVAAGNWHLAPPADHA